MPWRTRKGWEAADSSVARGDLGNDNKNPGARTKSTRSKLQSCRSIGVRLFYARGASRPGEPDRGVAMTTGSLRPRRSTGSMTPRDGNSDIMPLG